MSKRHHVPTILENMKSVDCSAVSVGNLWFRLVPLYMASFILRAYIDESTEHVFHTSNTGVSSFVLFEQSHHKFDECSEFALGEYTFPPSAQVISNTPR